MNPKITNVAGWKCWYVRKGGYWAGIQYVNGAATGLPYASYTWIELTHCIDGINGAYDNNPSPSVVPRDSIIIPKTIDD